jgi:serine/threonine protein kinase
MQIQSLLYQQIAIDEERKKSAPLLDYTVEFIPNRKGELKRIPIEMRLFRGFQSALFALSSKWIIKYQADCDQDDIHPILRESWALDLLAQSGISPKLLFVSPAVALPFDYTSKTDFTMGADWRRDCVLSGGVVRYMVMERLGNTIGQVVREKKLPLLDALKFTVSLIEVLKTLHDTYRVVHGDVHSLNLIAEDDFQVKLIDFGRSIFHSEIKRSPTNEPLQSVHYYLSPFELMGFTESFRDDVIRALQTLAFMIHGDAYPDHCDALTPRKMLEFKQDAFIYELPGQEDVIKTAVGGVKLKRLFVRQSLAIALNRARSVHDPLERPPYEEIISALQSAQKEISP